MSEHHHHNVSGKNLFITIILNIIITLSQIIGGIISGSLALLSDALHNFSDVLALGIAYVANRLAAKDNTKEKTFGYKRAEIIAALFNASVLIGIGIFLIIEAFHKFYHPEPINSVWVIALGLLSILLNAASVLLVKSDAHDNMNIKAAYLHLLTDVMTSIAVVVGGLLMYYFEIFWVDPLVSVIIAVYLIWASFGLVKESSAILMQFTPKEIELDSIVNTVVQESKIDNVHHIHVWKLDDHRIHLEAHLDFNENITLQEATEVIERLELTLAEAFDITHTTFQCEYNRCDNKEIVQK
ncbi:cation diffusion facilitator family transporter [Thiomicrorhabdus sp. Milos-T2]|uniref:cation diffusion facilitator family transporter n=1 Tax=Thiomicrorhabdus sp. Milos-T2 TaxID=90814 RepID=UPI000494444F|nr:cation diffusion facilitator family transporter [Thiomicrorhabdus sp. Milos-T2]